MALSFAGNGTITGLSVGGLPDGTVDSDTLASGTGGKVLQVVHAPYASVSSATVTYPTWSSNIFTGTITPSSTSNKVLIQASVNIGCATAGYNTGCRLLRGTTVIGSTPDSPGSNRIQTFSGGRVYSEYDLEHYTINYLDSPSSTSSQVYAIQITGQSATVYVNRVGDATDSNTQCRAVSHITLQEISA